MLTLFALGVVELYFSVFSSTANTIFARKNPAGAYASSGFSSTAAGKPGSSSSSQTCMTNDLGPQRNKSCVFPFQYRGQSIDHCLGTFWDDGKEQEVGAWCATTENFEKDQQWGYCGECSDSLPEQNDVTLCPSPPNSSWCFNWPKQGTQACYYLGGLMHYCDAGKMKELWDKPRQCKKNMYTIQLVLNEYTYIIKSGDTVECPCHCTFLNHALGKNLSSDLVMTDILAVPQNFLNDHSHAIRLGTYTESPILHSKLMSADGVNMFNYDAGYGPVIPEDKSSWFRIALYPQQEMFHDVRSLLHLPPLPFKLKKTRPMMAIWISNCGIEATGRNKVGMELQSIGVTLASYGNCVGNKLPDHKKQEFVQLFADLNETHPGVYDPYQRLVEHFGERYPYKILVSSLYLFSAAFENSDCEWYHTEKIYQALLAGVVPVYVGSTTIAHRVPKGSYIHVRNFTTSAELAKLLQSIAANETKYNEYLAWRTKPIPNEFYGYYTQAGNYPLGAPTKRRYMCELCETLDKVYGGPHKEMQPDTHCKRGAWKEDK
jgi:hypothetical protein